MKINPYQPPEAGIVGPAPPRPLPWHVFAAGALCYALMPVCLVIALLMSPLFLTIHWKEGWKATFEAAIASPMLRVRLVVLVLFLFCGFAFLGAGFSFFQGQGRRGCLFMALGFCGIGTVVMMMNVFP